MIVSARQTMIDGSSRVFSKVLIQRLLQAMAEQLDTERGRRETAEAERQTLQAECATKQEAVAASLARAAAAEAAAKQAATTTAAIEAAAEQQRSAAVAVSEQAQARAVEEAAAVAAQLASALQALQQLRTQLSVAESDAQVRAATVESTASELQREREAWARQLEHAEAARAAAEARAAGAQRREQGAQKAVVEGAATHETAVAELEADVQAYRRSEAHLQAELELSRHALADEERQAKQRSDEASTLHMSQIQTLMHELAQQRELFAQQQRSAAAEQESLRSEQREAVAAEEAAASARRDSVTQQQELELALVDASNKVKELSELLRLSIAKEERSASSVRELSHCVKAQREKLRQYDSECEALRRQRGESAEEVARGQAHAAELSRSLATAEEASSVADARLEHCQAELGALRNEMGARVTELQAAVGEEAEAAKSQAVRRFLLNFPEVTDRDSRLFVQRF
jgi:chromosome segregation ATPase